MALRPSAGRHRKDDDQPSHRDPPVESTFHLLGRARGGDSLALEALCACLFIILVALSSQAAEIRGTVTDATTGEPLPASTVQAIIGESTEVASTVTDTTGTYRLSDLAERSYTLVITRPNYVSLTLPEVHASRFAETVIDVALEPSPYSSDVMVITASRVRESGLGAPASTSVISQQQMTERPHLTTLDLTRDVTGVDFASKGLFQRNISMRGIRWAMSITPLLLTDYRFAHTPVYDFANTYMIPPGADDIERIEVVRGPNSVMYGPNSAQGVIHMITRSPFDSPGTMLSIAGGERSLRQGTFRYAAVLSDKVAFKISGRWLAADDWEYVDPVEQQNRSDAIAGGADPDTLLIGRRDNRIENLAGEARLDWRISPSTTAVLTAGAVNGINNIDLVHTIGALQYKNWRQSFVQGRLMSDRFMLNLFCNLSNTSDTYGLRTGYPIKDDSRVLGAQIQHGTDLAGQVRLVYGLDARHTNPQTFGTIMGRNEDDDQVTELGGYLSTNTSLSPRWDLIAALRVDYHDRIDDVAVSPRLGTVFRPTPSQAMRLTWNRAFNSPSAPEIFIDQPVGSIMPGMDLTVVGFSQNGYTFGQTCSGRPCARSPLYAGGTESLLPADATLMWPALVQILANSGIDLGGLPAPDASDVGTDLRPLDVQSGGYSAPVASSSLTDVPAVSRIISNTIELGYKGEISERLFLAVDVYRNHIDNYYGETRALNPNLFLNQGDLQNYLEMVGGLPADQAAAVAAAAAGIPLGTVVADGQETAEVLLVNELGGEFTNWGADLTIEARLSPSFLLSGYYSWLDKNIVDLSGVGEQVLSVPRNKASLGLTYRENHHGLDGQLQGRWIESYPVGSGVYSGQIGTYAVVDLGLAYRITWSPEVRVSVEAQNILDNRHQESIGAPELGRLVMVRVQVDF